MQQKGMALVLSLVFLAVVSVLAISAMRGSVLQERMAGNYREVELAFQGAEAALRGAERYIEGGASGPYDGSDGLYDLVGVAIDPHGTTTSWRTHGANAPGQQPEYFIERLPYSQSADDNLAADEPQQARRLYRITARGFGRSQESRVMLQSTYSH